MAEKKGRFNPEVLQGTLWARAKAEAEKDEATLWKLGPIPKTWAAGKKDWARAAIAVKKHLGRERAAAVRLGAAAAAGPGDGLHHQATISSLEAELKAAKDERDAAKLAQKEQEIAVAKFAGNAEMVLIGVEFLGNPEVQSTPWEEKVAFLRQKGLSLEEINEAKRRVEGAATAFSSSGAVAAASSSADPVEVAEEKSPGKRRKSRSVKSRSSNAAAAAKRKSSTESDMGADADGGRQHGHPPSLGDADPAPAKEEEEEEERNGEGREKRSKKKKDKRKDDEENNEVQWPLDDAGGSENAAGVEEESPSPPDRKKRSSSRKLNQRSKSNLAER